MISGIAIAGLNGAGKSTLAHALARELGYFEMDAEDDWFPEQSVSRRLALDGAPLPRTGENGPLPFSKPVSRSEAERGILEDMLRHPGFVFASVRMDWGEAITSRIGIVFLLEAPLDERLRRIRSREERRFGPRVLPGGDMYAQQAAFRDTVAGRDMTEVTGSLARLPCPIVTIDAARPVPECVRQMLDSLA